MLKSLLHNLQEVFSPESGLDRYLRSHAVTLRAQDLSSTGFLLDGAFILTAWHGLYARERLKVSQQNRSLGKAVVIGIDAFSDLALLCLLEPVKGKTRATLAAELPPHGSPAFFYSGRRQRVICTCFRHNRRPTPYIGFMAVEKGDSGAAVLTQVGHIASVVRGTLSRQEKEEAPDTAFGPNSLRINTFLQRHWPLYPEAADT